VTAKPELPREPILRDRLALDRTKLANERTLLAYLRTALVLVLSGITIIKLFQIEGGVRSKGMIVLASILLVVGIVTGIVGGVHCYRTARRMRQWERQLDAARSNSSPSGEQS
jgi:putative membrane protein